MAERKTDAAADAKLDTEVPAGPNWFHEIKYDGYRIIGRKAGDAVTLVVFVLVATLVSVLVDRLASRTGQPADVLLDTVAASGGALLQYWLSGRYGGRPAGAARGVAPAAPRSPHAHRGARDLENAAAFFAKDSETRR